MSRVRGAAPPATRRAHPLRHHRCPIKGLQTNPECVDADALVRTLEAGAIAGAAVDVFDEEPLPLGDRMRNTPGLLATPHIGYVTRETYEIFYGEMLEAIEEYLGGR